MGHPRRKKSAREHQAAVELASKRRQLSKLLKKEGFEPVPLDKKPKPQRAEEQEEHPSTEKDLEQPKTREEREREKAEKLEARKKRASLLMKRTRTGQPLMRNVVKDLVGKLTREN